MIKSFMRKILILIFIFLVSTGSSFSIEEEIRLVDNIEFEINPYEAKKVLFKNSVVDEFSPVLKIVLNTHLCLKAGVKLNLANQKIK